MKDALIICPKCGSDACYSTPLNETKNSYNCMGCGFQSNDLMIEGEFDPFEYEVTMPELHKDLKYIDDQKRLWYPMTLNIEGKGTLFANGTSVEDWKWSVIKMKELTEEEQKEAINKGAKFKSDPSTMKHFGNDFIEACDYLGLFEK